MEAAFSPKWSYSRDQALEIDVQVSQIRFSDPQNHPNWQHFRVPRRSCERKSTEAGVVNPSLR